MTTSMTPQSLLNQLNAREELLKQWIKKIENEKKKQYNEKVEKEVVEKFSIETVINNILEKVFSLKNSLLPLLGKNIALDLIQPKLLQQYKSISDDISTAVNQAVKTNLPLPINLLFPANESIFSLTANMFGITSIKFSNFKVLNGNNGPVINAKLTMQLAPLAQQPKQTPTHPYIQQNQKQIVNFLVQKTAQHFNNANHGGTVAVNPIGITPQPNKPKVQTEETQEIKKNSAPLEQENTQQSNAVELDVNFIGNSVVEEKQTSDDFGNTLKSVFDTLDLLKIIEEVDKEVVTAIKNLEQIIKNPSRFNEYVEKINELQVLKSQLLQQQLSNLAPTHEVQSSGMKELYFHKHFYQKLDSRVESLANPKILANYQSPNAFSKQLRPTNIGFNGK